MSVRTVEQHAINSMGYVVESAAISGAPRKLYGLRTIGAAASIGAGGGGAPQAAPFALIALVAQGAEFLEKMVRNVRASSVGYGEAAASSGQRLGQRARGFRVGRGRA